MDVAGVVAEAGGFPHAAAAAAAAVPDVVAEAAAAAAVEGAKTVRMTSLPSLLPWAAAQVAAWVAQEATWTRRC